MLLISAVILHVLFDLVLSLPLTLLAGGKGIVGTRLPAAAAEASADSTAES